MGQILHGSATTTEAVRRAIQHSQESLRALASPVHVWAQSRFFAVAHSLKHAASGSLLTRLRPSQVRSSAVSAWMRTAPLVGRGLAHMVPICSVESPLAIRSGNGDRCSQRPFIAA